MAALLFEKNRSRPWWAIGVILALAYAPFLRGAYAADEQIGHPDGPPQTIGQVDKDEAHSPLEALSLSYFGIFYGPSLQNPSAFQPMPDGQANLDSPLLLKNYLTLGYNLPNGFVVSGTGSWSLVPVMGQGFSLRDPYVRLARPSVLQSDQFNWYADLRVHFGVTSGSRDSDLLTGFQTFQILTYQLGKSRFTLGAYGSMRVNVFGKEGMGNDLEFYFGPNVSFQLTPAVALTLLYEAQVSHRVGDRAFDFYSDGTDLEPGVSWDITPNLNFNPYLNLYPAGKINFKSTSVGMMLSWKFL